jgi:hypothetical protein
LVNDLMGTDVDNNAVGVVPHTDQYSTDGGAVTSNTLNQQPLDDLDGSDPNGTADSPRRRRRRSPWRRRWTMSDPVAIDVERLVDLTDYNSVAARLQPLRRHRVGVMAALAERHEALGDWLAPGERTVCQEDVDLLWGFSRGLGVPPERLQGALGRTDPFGAARLADADDGHPAIAAFVAVESALEGTIHPARMKDFFDTWRQDVMSPAWDAWGETFSRPGSSAALIPIGLARAEFPLYAATYPDVRTELEYLVRLLDAVEHLRAADRLARRDVLLDAASPVPAPRWPDRYDRARYPRSAA